MKGEIEKIIQDALRGLDLEQVSFVVEHPADIKMGDYASNVAMVLAKQEGKNPRELADSIVSYLNSNLGNYKNVERVELAGPGFINFYLSQGFFNSELERILSEGESYGRGGEKGKYVVEYSSPNIAKPFTIGHLRSTIIGAAVANLLEHQGHEVVRDNHLGDWGSQFGKVIAAIKRWGDIAAISKSTRPVKKLVDLYVRFNTEAESDKELEQEGRDWFKKLEEGDAEARALWQKAIDWSMKEFDLIYERLGAKFDTKLGESFFEDKMPSVIEDLESKSLLKESDGAKLVFFDGDKYPPLMIIKSDGTTLYATRDLATDKYRRDTYGEDLTVINEVGVEQELYFKQLFEVEEMLGYFDKSQRVHVMHGHYRFKDGKMSTRKGNVIWLEDVLDGAIERAAKHNKESAEAVGIGAIKFNDLKRESRKDITFDWDEVLNIEGDSGPYLQYTHARANAVLEKGSGIEVKPGAPSQVDRLLYRYPEVTARAASHFAPHYLATYLLELASSFNSFYNQHQIVDKADKETSAARLAVTKAVATVLKSGLTLLGIVAPSRM